MKKIIILGPAGAGKTTLANRLSNTYNLPVFHFDLIKWTITNEYVDSDSDSDDDYIYIKDSILASLEEIKSLDNYIIEGTSNFLTELFESDITILFLNIDKITCINNLKSRGKATELPQEESDSSFNDFLISYEANGYDICIANLNNIINKVSKNNYNIITFNSLEEISNFSLE